MSAAAGVTRATRLLLIDGRSGAGKTTLAARLAALLRAEVVHLDDLYLGWDGLDAGSRRAGTEVLAPLAAGRTARFRPWDWATSRLADEPRTVEPGGVVIVEGCGSLSRANAAFADVALWLELDEDERHRRALERDADDSWWAGWRAQEDAFYVREDARGLADLVWIGREVQAHPSRWSSSSSMP